MPPSRELAIALELARLGGRIALGHFKRSPRRSLKSDGSWVTEADWAVEAQIRLRLARTFPEHNVLGEEEGLTAAGGGEPQEGAPTWVIDPIDGTHNYMVGIPVWATLVALRVGDQSIVGVAHAPSLQETYEAGRGLGARLNGEPIRVEPLDDLAEATYFSSGEAAGPSGVGLLHNELIARCWRHRGFGDFWGHMLVARGAGHVMLEPDLNLWDVAALEPIVEEAGGRISGLDGKAWSSGPCLTTCGSLHDPVLELLEEG